MQLFLKMLKNYFNNIKKYVDFTHLLSYYFYRKIYIWQEKVVNNLILEE